MADLDSSIHLSSSADLSELAVLLDQFVDYRGQVTLHKPVDTLSPIRQVAKFSTLASGDFALRYAEHSQDDDSCVFDCSGRLAELEPEFVSSYEPNKYTKEDREKYKRAARNKKIITVVPFALRRLEPPKKVKQDVEIQLKLWE